MNDFWWIDAMGRIRSIKPEFPHSESMGNVSRDSRLTFIMLWTLADDSGRLRGSSRMLASLLFPYDDDAPKKIDTWLGELEKEKCIDLYVVDGSHYVQIRNWRSHQKIDHATASKIPPKPSDSRTLARIREDSCEDQGLDGIKEGIGMDQVKDTYAEPPKDFPVEPPAVQTKPINRVRDEYSEDFETWWKCYPRREAKGAAWKAWPKALATIQQVQDIAQPIAVLWLIEVTRKFAESPKGQGNFVPHPATFLNEKRFDDDTGQWQRTDSNNRNSQRSGPVIGPGQVYDPAAAYSPL